MGDASEKMKESNNKLIQVTLTMFCDITKELSQKIKEATTENGKSPREIFTQPQIKSALKMFGDQLDWINNLLEDYMKDMKDNKMPPAISGAKSSVVDEKKKTMSSRLSFKSKK